MKKLLLTVLLAIAGITVASAQPAPTPADWHAFNQDHAGAHQERQPLTKQEFLKNANEHFDSMDTNKDGIISPDEMHSFHEQMMLGMPHGDAPKHAGKKHHHGHCPMMGEDDQSAPNGTGSTGHHGMRGHPFTGAGPSEGSGLAQH
jgi:hypothetical protein